MKRTRRNKIVSAIETLKFETLFTPLFFAIRPFLFSSNFLFLISPTNQQENDSTTEEQQNLRRNNSYDSFNAFLWPF